MAKLKLYENGSDTYIEDSDIQCDLPFTNVEDMVKTEIDEVLEARKDWTIHTSHVKEVKERYTKFYSQFQTGDRLAFFCHDGGTLSMRAGILLLRENKIVAYFLTAMS